VTPWQTCTPASPTGTVAGSAVAVEVACATNHYKVTGVASGLLLAGLSLRSGADALAVDADGVFTFATAIASGDPYAVTTTALPATQACALLGASGTVGGADLSVTVTCGCAGGLGNCDGVASNGCETDTRTTALACGTCGNACAGGVECVGGVCTAPTCSDRRQNGNETDVDCGGSCSPCADGLLCARAADCRSLVCTAGHCAAPRCDDLLKNGTETDVDCGGGSCPGCRSGLACASDGDCASGHCRSGTCVPDVLVVRIGDGSATLSTSAAAVFLERRSGADGASVATIALPTAVSGSQRRLTLSGTATSEGALARSADGKYVTLAGYDAAPGTATVASSTTASVNRVVGRVDSAGTIDTSTALDVAFNAASVRAAVTEDGTAFWVAGQSSGVQYATLGSTTGATQLTVSPTNLRTCEIAGSQLYCDAASGTFQSVFAVGSGLPTTTGQTATVLPGLPTTAGPSPYAFALLDRNANVAGLDTLYLADDRTTASGGGLQKWTFNGITWTLAKTFTNGLGAGLRGVTAWTEGANVVLVVSEAGTPPNRLLTLVDEGSLDPSYAPTFSAIATSPADTVYRGVVRAPE
jgi:hypothetical protein